MDGLFLKVLEMSVTGSIVILITMLARFLLKKRSKRFIMILWAVVAIRLLVPFSFESSLSIFNFIPLKTQTLTATSQVQEAAMPDGFADTQFVTADYAAMAENQDITLSETAGNETLSDDLVRAETLPDIKTVLSTVWLVGALGITVFYSVRFVMLKRKLRNAKKISGNVYVSEKISAPFVFGFFVPRIYLPDVLENSEKEYVLLHEKTHIKHGDWLIKIIGMFAVAVHWFNPIVWIAYMLFEQDIEMSCDESVVAGMDTDLKQAYTMSIVSFAKQSSSKRYLVTPLGFSKVNFSKTEVTNRVKNIINFKKGKTVTAVGITAVLIFVGVVCGLNSKTNADEADSVNEPVAEATETAETETAEMPVESKESEVLQNTAGTIAESTTADVSEQETADETTVETTAASEETTSETTAASEETKASETTAASEPDGTPENDKSSGPDSKSGPASDENTGSSKEPAPGSDEDSSEYIDTPGGRLYLSDLIEKDKNYKETPVSKTVYLLQDSKVRTGPGYYAFEEVSTMARDTKVEVVAETDSGWYKLDSGYYIEKSHCWDKRPSVIDASGDFASYLKWYIDCPYTFASASVYGFDASGFVMYCYMDYYGISLPHGSNSIWKLSGREVSRDELQVGDIICYDYGDYCGHVAIYIGDGQVIHASSSRGCVCYDDLDMMTILGIKRVID